VVAGRIAADGEGPRLVEGEPGRHAASEALEGERGVSLELGEDALVVGRVPAAPVLVQRLRQVPVVEGDVRGDARLEEPVEEVRVPGDARLVGHHGVAIPRHHAAPGKGEPIVLQPELRHERDVVPPAVDHVVRHIARVAAGDCALGMRKHVPD